MKQLKFVLLVVVLVIVGGGKSFAHDIEAKNADGVTIYYCFIKNDTELAVDCRDNYSATYTGRVAIPESVIYNGKTLPVTTIGWYAFSYCYNLNEVVIPNSVTSIYEGAFIGCTGLTELTIPESVTFIDLDAFYGCSGLTEMILPSSVTSIGNYAFYWCNSLKTLYSLNTTPPSIWENTFTGDQFKTVIVYVPQDALAAYQKADDWKNFWNLQGFDPTGIGNVKVEGKGDNIYYDLKGNRLDNPKRGLNIIKGKKIIVK